MRISAKADYAVRAMAELAARSGPGPVTAVSLAQRQDIPQKFLQGVLADLRRAHLVRSSRGPDGGFELARAPASITLADIFRAVDGPLLNVRDVSLTELSYSGAAEPLRAVWMAARTSLRHVLDTVTIADLAGNTLSPHILSLAADYEKP